MYAKEIVMNTKHRGANGFQLKLLALITMTMDHIAVYLPGAPDWFHYAGRLAAPIFLYLCMEGFFYTHSRTRHLARMYILSSLMKAGSLALCLTLPRGTGLTNDIFQHHVCILLDCAGNGTDPFTRRTAQAPRHADAGRHCRRDSRLSSGLQQL